MAQNVRNFWLETKIDGAKTGMSGGPRAEDGGFSLRIMIRSAGSVARAVDVEGISRLDGSLLLVIKPKDGCITHQPDGSITIETQR